MNFSSWDDKTGNFQFLEVMFKNAYILVVIVCRLFELKLFYLVSIRTLVLFCNSYQYWSYKVLLSLLVELFCETNTLLQMLKLFMLIEV